jgi:hypothetical protein
VEDGQDVTVGWSCGDAVVVTRDSQD